jgi:hypothetical protein
VFWSLDDLVAWGKSQTLLELAASMEQTKEERSEHLTETEAGDVAEVCCGV